MSLSRPIILLTLAFLAAPALACGNGECDPPAPEAPAARSIDHDGEPVAPGIVQLYGYCCQIDGRTRLSVAWGADPDAALAQCLARAERLGKLPACLDRLAMRIRRLEGGE